MRRDVRGGESQAFRITLEADQYLAVVVEQRGIDVIATLVGPDGAKHAEVTSTRGRRPQTLTFVAAATGDYRLEVRASDRNAPQGQYDVTVAELRAPTADERRVDEARRAFNDARESRASGRYAAAVAPAERAVTIRESVLGPTHPAVADALHLLASIYDDLSDYTKAESVNTRALAIREQTLGPDDPDVARSLVNLAWIYQNKDLARAEPTYLRALAIQERALGPDHPELASTLNDLALLYDNLGDYDRSILINERVVGIRRKALGPEAPGVAKALNNLALVYTSKAEYEKAEPVLEQAVAIWEKALGPDHPDVAFGIDNLARAHFYLGNYVRAESLYLRALAIRERALGPEHTELGTTLNNLAVLYRQTGDLAKSEQLLVRAIALTEKAQGPNDASVAALLNNLARVYEARDETARAEPLYRRSLAIREVALGPTHPDVGRTLTLLGNLSARSATSDPEQAEALLQRALAMQEKALGPEHPDVASVLLGLATVAGRQGRLALAAEYDTRALAIQERTLGADHPSVARTLDDLARLARLDRDRPKALTLMARAAGIRERYLAHNLLIGSERQKSEHLRLFADDADRALSLLAGAPTDTAALRLALDTQLQRKGRALDATTDSVGVLRARAATQDQELFDRLSQVRTQLAGWSLRDPAGMSGTTYRSHLLQLQSRADELEADLSRRSAAFRAESRPVTLDAVQAAIPDGAVLIEFALYRVLGDGADAPPPTERYAAFVLRARAEPRWVDLGGAEDIDRAVAAWRAALADPRRRDVDSLGRQLDMKLMRPVRPLLAAEEQLLISPDGQLNVIPFAALVDERGRHLVEDYTISYLTSGRDLLRLQVPRESKSEAVVVAAPAFGDPPLLPAGEWAGEGATPEAPRVRVDYSQVFFGPLPGVREEVRALRTLLPQAAFLTGEEANKDALRRVHGPRLLHVATHGFFLPDRQDDAEREAQAVERTPGTRLARWAGTWTANPLLRSGLALAGANQSRDGDNKGILTALEAASLDLWGTKLVVLSACDTGTGDVRRAEGVYGLRRALFLAGAESALVSLWPVSDRGTRDLMRGYYTRLTHGDGRSESLRQVQLQMLQDARSAHPYYWAGFIQSGQWAGLYETP